MKKQILPLFLLMSVVMTGFSQSISPDLNVSKSIRQSFEKTFPDAGNVRWEKSGDLYAAEFMYGKDRVTAFFEEDGEHYKTTRYIDQSNLPLAVTRALYDRFDLKGKCRHVLEVSRLRSTSYLVSFDYNNRSYIVESDSNGNLGVVKKTRIG